MDLSKHHSLKVCSEVLEVCKPLFSTTHISHFTYSRLYNDGKVLVLVTDPEYHQHFWKNKYQKEFFQNYLEGVHYARNLSHQALRDARDYGILHPTMRIYRRENYYEGFGFGTSCSKMGPIDFYTQHIEVMNHFQLYFRNLALPLILMAQKNLLDSGIGSQEKWQSLNPHSYNSLEVPYLWVELPGKNPVQLSQKQYFCLKYMARGMTAKGISQKLNISHRTVEKNIENIKDKLDICNRNVLINTYLDQFEFERSW